MRGSLTVGMWTGLGHSANKLSCQQFHLLKLGHNNSLLTACVPYAPFDNRDLYHCFLYLYLAYLLCMVATWTPPLPVTQPEIRHRRGISGTKKIANMTFPGAEVRNRINGYVLGSGSACFATTPCITRQSYSQTQAPNSIPGPYLGSHIYVIRCTAKISASWSSLDNSPTVSQIRLTLRLTIHPEGTKCARGSWMLDPWQGRVKDLPLATFTLLGRL
jgi:hypothetical protein